MAKYPDEVTTLLMAAADKGLTTGERGKAYEDLFCLLLDGIVGIDPPPYRNTLNKYLTEEVDIAVANLRHYDGLRQLPEIFLVECKNWSSPVGSAEVAYFRTVLKDRACTLGILFAANGVTGDPESRTAAHFVATAALLEGIRIIVVTHDDITKLKSDSDFIRLLHTRLLGLHACATFVLD